MITNLKSHLLTGKKLLTLLLFVFMMREMVGQNLVPNPSFEVDTACPNTLGQIYYARPWFQPCIHYGNTSHSSSDLYNVCSTTLGNKVPSNTQGFQHPRTGNSYAGIIVNDDTTNYREYIEVPLISPLVSGRNYCVEYYVSLAEISQNAISNMGVYFSVDSLLDTTLFHAMDYVTPQLENPVGNILNDTANWMFISGSFIANGGEKFMTIGNFHNVANTNWQVVPTISSVNMAYYYIDDVSVVDCGGAGVTELIPSPELTLYPNPAGNELGIKSFDKLRMTELGIKEVKVFNVLGSEILSFDKLRMTNNVTIDVSKLPRGLYFAEIETEKGVVRRRFVKE